VRNECFWAALGVFLFLGILPAAAQDPSDPVFDEGGVANITLTMNSTDWSYIRNNQADNDSWFPATFTWQPPGGAVETFANAGVRASGGYSVT